MAQYSLAWEEHPKNICSGLSYLQQNGEFVDMTLAADGHIVKVHQVIMALSSPYLKDIIASANCPHPVIMLNKISHSTLSAILEYVYTGEVRVAIDDIRELIDAAKDLHIRGLQDMDLSVSKQVKPFKEEELEVTLDTSCANTEDEDISADFNIHDLNNISMNECKNMSLLVNTGDCDRSMQQEGDLILVTQEFPTEAKRPTLLREPKHGKFPTEAKRPILLPMSNQGKHNTLQYTISTHGSVQLILNRFIYHLKHTRLDQSRQWRCVDYLRQIKCPAVVITKGNMVLQRIKAHKHPFHDQKILKKVRKNNVFAQLEDAEQSGANLKNQDSEEHLMDSE